jgi:hypothetical protein
METKIPTKRYILLAFVALMVVLLGVVTISSASPPKQGPTNFDAVVADGNLVVNVPTQAGTATPGIYVNQQGLGLPLVVAKAGTPVFSVNSAGDITFSGTPVINGLAYVNAPTSVATSTPALFVNSLGVSNLFEVRDASTPVWAINNGGAVVAGGAGSYAGVQTFNNNAIVNAPTSVATAVPAFSVDSLGVSNLFEVRDAATPVLQVNNGGAIVTTGSLDVGGTLNYGTNNLYVMGYASSGNAIICGSATVTDTATIATGLTTPAFCLAGLTDTPGGDARSANCAVSSTNIVVKVRNSALTPVANATGALINWCAIGAK